MGKTENYKQARFRFAFKLEVFFIKMLKTIEVYDFASKKFVIFFCQTQSVFWTVIQDLLKRTFLPWAQHHF